MNLQEPGFVVPLGVFGVLAGQRQMDRLSAKLRSLAGQLPEQDRGVVANYLRSGKVVLAIMEYTRDVLDGRFGVSGGSAIYTDGVYYWRGDAADYVENYGVELPAEFLEHGRRLRWTSPSLTEAQLLEIDDYLSRRITRLDETAAS